MAWLPEGLRIYAVGDVHGRFDLLQDLYGKIRKDLASSPTSESVEIFLGDYVDRGPQSREVVDWMISEPPATARRVCLLGNHEDLLLSALSAPTAAQNWLYNGGLQTLLSYRPLAEPELANISLSQAQRAFAGAFPDQHRRFVQALPRTAVLGGYIFVHAGLRPGRTLEQQDPDDLVWIREPFLSSSYDFGKIVVHGHTPREAPEVRPNRINIDTGAFITGRLTCVVLEGKTRKFLRT